MNFAHSLAATAALAGASLVAQTASAEAAQTTVYALKDIGTFGTYQQVNIGQTFSGTGFVGLYNDGSFAHLFGLEGGLSRTAAQIDLSNLLGRNIQSATLSYSIRSNFNPSGNVTITGSGGTGALGYTFDAPTTNYGTAFGTTLGTNAADVTNLVVAATKSGNNWLNLFLESNVGGNWTYTAVDYGANSDSAAVRLTVNYTDAVAAVPEPATWAMMLVGFGFIGFAMRRRSSKVSTNVTFA